MKLRLLTVLMSSVVIAAPDSLPAETDPRPLPSRERTETLSSTRCPLTTVQRRQIIPDFLRLPDPLYWLVEPETGLRYRRATEREREANDWEVGTYLVETQQLLSFARRGRALKGRLPVPVWDDDVHVVSFLQTASETVPVIEMRDLSPHRAAADAAFRRDERLLAEEDGLPSIGADRHPVELLATQGPTVTASYRDVEFHNYISREFDDDRIALLADELGGFTGVGFAGRYHVDIWLHQQDWLLEPLPVVHPDGSPQNAPPRRRLVVVSLLRALPGEEHDLAFCELGGDCGDLICKYLPRQERPEFDLVSQHPCVPHDPPQPPSVVGTCNNAPGTDDDGDGLANLSDPDCKHRTSCLYGLKTHFHKWEAGFDFLFTADTHFCTEYANSWASELHTRTSQMLSIYYAETGHEPYDAHSSYHKHVVRTAALQCWVMDDADQARACNIDGGNACHPYQPGTTHWYPFGGLFEPFASGKWDYKVDADSIINHAWAAVEHASRVGMSVIPQLSYVAVGAQSLRSAGALVCGKATFPDELMAGTAVSSYFVCGGETMAHELGHAQGLTHCVAEEVDDGVYTVMATSDTSGDPICGIADAARVPRFGSTGAVHLLDCQTDDALCPASPQFGCLDDDDCATGFQCNDNFYCIPE
jgi:hypothetical protein